MLYDVQVRIIQESLFSVEIEADSETDAEDTAQSRIWNDSYTQELRASLEIVDEEYEAELWGTDLFVGIIGDPTTRAPSQRKRVKDYKK